MQPDTANRSTRSEAMDRIDEALRRDDREVALQELEQAGRDDPFNDELPLLSALLHLEAGRPSPAAKMAVRTLDMRPFHPGALNLLAVACLDAAQPQLARRLLLRAVRMAPGLETLRANLENARGKVRDNSGGAREAKPTAMLPRKAIRRLLERDRQTLSVCVLLEDGQEEKLQACLRSLDAIADEVVIADRRSNAGNLDCLGGLAAILVAAGPEQDRAQCRDAALRRSRGDWVLVLSADERLAPGSDEHLPAALTDDDCVCRLVQIAGAAGTPPHRAVRLVRNAPGIRFHPIADDCMLDSVVALEADWKLGIGHTEIRIERDAPRSGGRAAEDRQTLRSRIDRALEQNASDVRALYALGRIELEEGRAAQALVTVRGARALLEAEPSRRRAIELEEPTLLEGRCLMRLQRYAELSTLIADYHTLYPATCGTLFLEGLAAKGLKRPRRAVELLETAVEIRELAGFAAAPPELSGPGLPDLLGATWLELGELERAASAFDAALAFEPEQLEAQLGQIAIRHARGELEPMLRDLDGLLEAHGDDPRTWIAGSILFAETPALARPAIGWLEEACLRFPHHPELRRRLGEAQLRTGGAEAALETWHLANLDAGGLVAGKVAAALAAGQELPALSVSNGAGLDREVLTWFQRWFSSGAYEALDRALLDIERAEERVPGLGELTARWLESIGQSDAASGVRLRAVRQGVGTAPLA